MSDKDSLLEDAASKKSGKSPDWSRFGLGKAQEAGGYQQVEDGSGSGEPGKENELFKQDLDQTANQQPWWKANFLITQPVLFGTWDGVFTSCMINIFGVVIFLRTGWMVGNVGIGLSVLIIALTITCALIAVLSAIGVCERCKIESGGVYFLLSHVLGARFGAAMGIIYCFGQAVASSLYTVGFGESIASLFKLDNEWVAKGIAILVVILLLAINLAGVKWVIRLQLILLIILFISVLDFLVGSFVKTNPAKGVTGYNLVNWRNNTGQWYADNETFFTVFGVFFPTATGVFAGVNMSGDLRDPKKNIPVGTLSAVGVSTFLYLCFALVLGATCTRIALQEDYMIASKVAVLGPLLLTGLYVSSLSAALGGLTGAPRVLQAIASGTDLPLMGRLGETWGANKVPVFSLMTITIITLIFILIGNVNVLGPIVTMPFMLTYASLDYAYFSLAMSFDIQGKREERFARSGITEQSEKDGSPVKTATSNENATTGKSGDLDSLFPERRRPGDTQTPTENILYEAEDGRMKPGSEKDALLEGAKAPQSKQPPINMEISRQPRSWYSILLNRWLSLLGALLGVVVMFSIKWSYALACICVVLALFIYIGQANPGVFPGIAEFSMINWIRGLFRTIFRRGPAPQEEVFIPPRTPAMPVQASRVTEDNQDYATRGRYHQAQLMQDGAMKEALIED